jgi:hypothetical protein
MDDAVAVGALEGIGGPCRDVDGSRRLEAAAVRKTISKRSIDMFEHQPRVRVSAPLENVHDVVVSVDFCPYLGLARELLVAARRERRVSENPR